MQQFNSAKGTTGTRYLTVLNIWSRTRLLLLHDWKHRKSKHMLEEMSVNQTDTMKDPVFCVREMIIVWFFCSTIS